MPSLAVELAQQPATSLAIDDLIMGTNNNSIVSKRSVERLYHPDEPHFFRYFVNKPQRRSALINRSYWLRLKVVDVVVRQFLTGPSSRKRVIINLGCGSDALPWQCHTRLRDVCDDALFVDVDYPDLMRKKRDAVLRTPQLREILGSGVAVGELDDNSPLLLRSAKYCQLGCDLRELGTLRSTLDSFLDLSQCAVLFIAEDSITYMDTHSADSLIHWASSVSQAEFCLLEPILPHGAHHPFAQNMFSHLDKANTQLRSVHIYPTLEKQRARFHSHGWTRVEVWDLWQAWSSDRFLSSSERALLDDVEPFDEWEEFILFARHYCVLHASAALPGEQSQTQTSVPTPSPDTELRAEMEVTSHCLLKAPRRRFGNTMKVSNSMGQPFLLHMMGMSANSRSDTYDVYSLDHSGTAPKLPHTGPLPRTCYTITDLGDFGFLLVGGCGAQASALADCWIFEKGGQSRWRTVASLPVPLFRHAAIRLGNSSLALVMGGRTGPSRISENHLIFHPERGWLNCQINGISPEPTFGAVLCHSPESGGSHGVFCGLLAGGMNQGRTIVAEKYLWHVEMTGSQPIITFKRLESRETETSRLSLFGAASVSLGRRSAICGGMGHDASLQGQTITTVEITGNGYKETRCCFGNDKQNIPFMIGCSLMPFHKGLIVVGGGATCFSMGTFWETGMYHIAMPDVEFGSHHGLLANKEPIAVECMASHRVANIRQEDRQGSKKGPPKATMVTIPRLRLSPEKGFREVLRARQPVIIEGLELGECLGKWTPEYMTGRVGEKQEVVVHECRGDVDMMDFTSKNFRYVTETFANVMQRMQAGGRLYLRSLSQEKSSELPANIENDFPLLAKDFCLPAELDFVRDHLFSSILRASGRVSMWLHYDVMANVYAQVSGSKKMVLFPPADVTSLSFAPGASSSSVDVFSSFDAGDLSGTHPHEAMLYPGDVLLLPALWPHTSTPTTDMSIAVNVFFRDLESGYAQGRDVYGNRDMEAYEKGRQEAARIVKICQKLPADSREFYLGRIADELRQAAEGK